MKVNNKYKGRILLGVCGSVACYKACELVSQLKQNAFDIIVCMTEEAKRFVSPLTFQTLSGNKVIVDIFEDTLFEKPVHINLSSWADIIVIAPASANIISKLASGVCDDILTLTLLSTNTRVIIAPAMNENMYNKKIIQDNIKILKSWGYIFLGPVKGWLSCGYEGLGKMSPPDIIVKEIRKLLG